MNILEDILGIFIVIPLLIGGAYWFHKGFMFMLMNVSVPILKTVVGM